jgi:hypothetical protein
MINPSLSVATGNVPANIMSRLQALEIAVYGAQRSESERLFEGQISAELFLFPAQGVVDTDPTSVEYTGGFACGEGIEFNGETFTFGYVKLGVLQWGGKDSDAAFWAGLGIVRIDADGITIVEGSAGGKPGQYAPNSLNFSDGAGNIVSEMAAYKSNSSGYRVVRLRTIVPSDITKKGLIDISVLDTAGTTIYYGIQIDGSGGITFFGPSGILLTVTDTLIDAKKQLDYPFVGVRVYKNAAAQSISNATLAAVTFDAENNDSDGYHDNVTNNSRLTVPAGKAGMYSIAGLIQFASGSAGYRQAQLRVNGATIIGSFLAPPISGTVVTSVLATTHYYLNDGDYVELLAYHTAGLAINVNQGLGNTWFSMVRVGK